MIGVLIGCAVAMGLVALLVIGACIVSGRCSDAERREGRDG